MLYSEFQKNSLGEPCAFCSPGDRIFLENEAAFLTYSIAPYHPHHLLIIPKEHKRSFTDLNQGEITAVWDLIRQGGALMRKLGYGNYSVLVRDGDSTAKTMRHIHFHLIPEDHIGDLDWKGGERVVLSEEEIRTLSDEVKKILQVDFSGETS